MAGKTKIGIEGSTLDGEKSATSREMVSISPDMEGTAVLELDSQGMKLLFDGQDSFIKLDDSIVGALSRDNKQRYLQAKDFHASWRGIESNEFAAQFTVPREGFGTPMQKLEAKLPKGYRHRWVRPELVRQRMELGYKVVGDEGKSFVGSKNGVHKVGLLGHDELVLMAIPEADFSKRQVEKAVKNSKRAGMYKESFAQEAAKTGLAAFDESKDTKDRRWTEQMSIDD